MQQAAVAISHQSRQWGLCSYALPLAAGYLLLKNLKAPRSLWLSATAKKPNGFLNACEGRKKDRNTMVIFEVTLRLHETPVFPLLQHPVLLDIAKVRQPRLRGEGPAGFHVAAVIFRCLS